jgi:O-glycosyl hydrolase
VNNSRIKLAILSIFVLFGSVTGPSAEAQPVLIDPSITYQEVEGWGGSLCWWANIMGGYSDTDILKICDWITDPDGLNMNIFRFNIGGGDDPAHNHLRGDGGNMPGYKASATDSYDWTQDENQRKILQQLIASRVEQTGSDDIILEAFSNSPPYWMTKSGCSSGSVEGNVSNLKADMYDDFADYLTEVVKYYHETLNITFDYLEPFNEPYSTWWDAFGDQEGCYFGQADQEKMIGELYTAMESKNMTDYCSITAMDASSLDECYNGITAYKESSDILQKLHKINGHSYFGSDNSRKNLARFSHENDIKLWQSESGPLNSKGSSEELIVLMAQRIVRDMKEMKCPAWIDWQLAADNSPQWGILVGQYGEISHPVVKGYAYYIRTQFSRFIKRGYTIIDVKDENTLAAISPDGDELVIVVANDTDDDKSHSYDMGAFIHSGSGLQYRTRVVNSSYTEKNFKTNLTFSEDLLEYSALAQSVTTFVIPVEISGSNIAEGRYYIRNKAANKYVGIKNASVNLGARLQITGDTPGENSAFDLSVDHLRGGFRMKPGHLDVSSDYVLDVEGISNSDGANIMQYSDWGGENQRFHFVHMEDYFYKILIRRSMKNWSIPGSSFEIGEDVVQLAWDDTDNSIWEITHFPVSVFDEESDETPIIQIWYQRGSLNIQTSNDSFITDISIMNVLGSILLYEPDIYTSNYSRFLYFDPGVYLIKASLSDGLTYSDLFMIN